MAKSDEYLSSGNLRNLKECILDEKKLVTYISLSKDFCIHINEAKTLLNQLVEEIQGNNTNTGLNVSYIVSGLSDNNSGRTIVCSGTDLAAHRASFKSISYQHIYSVCEGSSGVDIASFASVNKFEDFPLCTGLIKGNLCTKRSIDEIGTLKSNSQKTVDEQKQDVHLKKESKEKHKEVVHNGHKDNVVKVHESKSEVTSPKKDIVSTSNGKSSTKNVTKSSKGITGFFSKSNSGPIPKSKISKEKAQENNNKTVKIETHPEPKETQSKVKTEPEVEVNENFSMDIDETIPVKVKMEQESTKKNNKKNNSLNQIKKNAKVDKKRKRVLHVSDSDSDDNDPFAEDKKPINLESDDEIPPTPSTNTIKITSGILNPKKRRKIVDKTYTDDEGYILTRKEEIYESCSEEDVEMVKTEQSSSIQVKTEKENVECINKRETKISPKEKKGQNSKKKVSPPQKGKQASIMNFFKKV